jgi:hypothetical protein
MTSGKRVLGLLLGICILNSVPAFSQENANNVLDSRRQILVDTARDVEKLNAALLNYWQDNRAWPVALNQLQTLGYINAIPISPRGTPYVGAPVNANRQYRLSFDLVDNTSAATVAGILPNGTVVGAVVSTIIETPNSSNEYQSALGRNLDPDFADRVVMKNNLDMGTNSINNANALDATDLNATNLNSTGLNATRVNVGRAVVGSGSIQSSGTNLNVNAQTVATTSNATVGRNVTVSGQVQGGSLTTNNLNVAGNVNSSSGNLTGFSTATGSSANIAAVNAASVNTDSVSTSTGTATNVTTASLNAGRGVFTGVSTSTGRTQTGNAQSGSVRNATGGGVTAQTFTGNTVNAGSINAQSSNVGTANASTMVVGNQTTGTAGSSNVSTSNDLTATTANATNYNSTTSTASNASVSGNTVLTGRLVTSGTLNATNIKSNDAQIGALTVRNGATVSGTASAQTLNVAGNLQAQSVNAQSANINNLSGATLNGTTVNANTVNGTNFTGTDFITPISSVMNNRALITDQKNKLDTCMYATTYCFPKPPAIANPQCPNCTQSGYLLSFTAVASATISSCQHGCTYEWVVGGSASASCPAGSIAKMNSGSVSVSCTLTRNQAEGASSTGTVSLVVKNARRNEYSATHNFNYSFTSATASIPASSITCTNCTNTTASENPVLFNSSLTATYANCEYGCSLVWGGVCTGTIGNTCFYSRTLSPGQTETVNAEVTVRSNANALKQSTVSRTITYTLNYPACPSNQIRTGGVCGCAVGSTWDGSTCVGACPANQVRVGGVCQCPANTTWNGSTCAASCTGGQILVGGVCQCPANYTWNGMTCEPDTVTYLTPTIVTSCANCSNTTTSAAAQTYNMTITANYNNCHPGQCDLTWGAAPAGFSKTTCSNVRTPAGVSSGTVQCSLSTTVTPGTTRSGSVPLTSRNVTDTSKVTTTSQPVSFTVDTVSVRTWQSGCYVDTMIQDFGTSGGCNSAGVRSAGEPASIQWSAGDVLTSNLEDYTLSNSSGVSIVWSGDCTGSGNLCRIYGPCHHITGCKELRNKSATVRIYLSGVLVHQATIYAEDFTLEEGAIPD